MTECENSPPPRPAGAASGTPRAVAPVTTWPGAAGWAALGLAASVLAGLAWSWGRSSRRPGRDGARDVPMLDRYRLLSEHTRDIALFIGGDGRIVEANDAAVAAYGYDRASLLGRHIADLRDPSTAPSLADQMARADAVGLTFETVHLRRDGTPFPVEVSSRGAEVDGRRLLLSLIRDISERKRAEADLVAARDAAEAATRSRDQFLAVLSHELRNPLMPVLISISALMDDPETPGWVRPTLELTRRNVELEARLIDDLLDVTRIAQGKLRLDRVAVDAHDLALRAVEICRDEISAKSLRLEVDLRAEARHVEADPARLQQVLWNLIKNAAKFTPEGGRVAVRSRDEPGRLAIEVSDSGIGIPPESLPRIFDAFEQGDPAVTRRFGGLGLGLAISRSLAEAHGGALVAASQGHGLGSTFTLTLPTIEAPRAAPPGADHDPEDRSPMPALRILLVEDDPDSLRIMARLLARSGHRVATAASLAEALRVADSDVLDLVISDIGLPDGSGLDLMRQLRPRVSLGGIALTGFGMEDDLRRSDQAGFVAHLTKPVDFAGLEDAIRRVARRGGVDAAPG